MIRFLILVCGYIICGATTHGQERPLYWSDFFSSDRQHTRASIRHIERGGIGYNHGYTTFESFLAPNPHDVRIMPFLDVRGHLFDNGKGAANIGFGLRSRAGCRVYGANVYYDFRNTQKNNYNQVGFGFETLGKRWDLRANGYLPVGKKITCPYNTQFFKFSGNSMLLKQQYQFAMAGVNAEAGVYFGRNRFVDFYAAVGPYFFTGTKYLKPHVWGGKIRFICRLKEYATFELSNSYDNMFHNRFQLSFTLTMPFGSGADPKKSEDCNAYGNADVLYSRMTLPVVRQEIVVVGCGKKCAPALDPATGEPYKFIFVDNTSHSEGTFRSPYPTLAQAEENSNPGNIIYVFPGDGTTKGMDNGITLQLDQKFWGSGVAHPLLTAQGPILIPALTNTAPIITNVLDGDGITVAARNQISGFTVTNASERGIFGANIENISISECTINHSVLDNQIYLASNKPSVTANFSNLILTNGSGDAISLQSTANSTVCTVDNCTFKNDTVYCINLLAKQADVSVTNNTFDGNANGNTFTFNGPATLVASGNTIKGITSASEGPFTIIAGTSPLVANITNNVISNNTRGTVSFALNGTDSAQLTIKNNTIVDNGSGSGGTGLGSSLVINAGDTASGNCSVTIANNTISRNAANGVYFHTSGEINNLNVNATENTLSNNAAGGFIFATPTDTFTLNATNNSITNNGDQAISTQAPNVTTANITISNNKITGNISGSGNGLSVNHSGTNLNLTVTNNDISENDGSGIVSYSGTGIENVTVNIANNTINNNQNAGSNGSGGIDFEQYINFSGTLTNNTVLNNVGSGGVYIDSTLTAPSACVTMTGNNTGDAGYVLNPSNTGTFNLAPCNVSTINTGAITGGTITTVESCPTATPCS